MAMARTWRPLIGSGNAPGRGDLLKSTAMSELDPSGFDVLTFDCYGTLIDWETGLLGALHSDPGAGTAWRRPTRRLLEAHGAPRGRPGGRRVPGLPRDVLAQSLQGPRPRLRVRARRGQTPRASRRRLRSGLLSGDSAPIAGAVEGALRAGRDHQLRRRPVRIVQPQSSAWRFDYVGSPLSRWAPTSRASRGFEVGVERHRRAARSGSARGPEPVPRPRSRPSRSGLPRSGSTAARGKAGGRRDAACRGGARRGLSPIWRRSPTRSSSARACGRSRARGGGGDRG